VLLIVTQRDDYHADWLVLELQARNADFTRFNTEDYPLTTSLHWTHDGAARLRFGECDYDLADVTAVWYRRPAPPVVAADLPEATAAWARGEAREALMGVWRTLDALWVNNPDRNRIAESKLLQLRTARELGFDIPDSLVSNEPAEVEDFMAANPHGVICKPLMTGRVPVGGGGEQLFFTSQISPESVSLAALGAEPYLFQELIPKLYDVRVTVIGTEAFAARIESQESEETRTDWRRGHPGELAHTPIELPEDVASACLALCRRLGLEFGAIDLAHEPDGRYTFFEINPNGQWAWVEQRTGLPLRARLSDLLLSR
jgi:glutathione synthase/RimK-type ligase-like ATP-grasp enzyme